MSSLECTSYLHKLFEAHGVPCTIHDDWVVPNSQLPAIRAFWHPGKSSGRLDVHAFVGDRGLIEECFAGIGEEAAGLHDALANFTMNSFHVLLASLWGVNDDSQVTTEDWAAGARRYTAYVGNFGTRGLEGTTAQIPTGLFDEMERTIKNEPLTQELHWFRFFFCNLSGAYTFEALKDNEPWEAGVRCLEAAPWIAAEGYYSVRLFAVLRAA